MARNRAHHQPTRHKKKLKINSYKLLTTSWSVQTKNFFEHSTLHGVRYIAENGRPFLEKFMWFCCLLIGSVTTLVIIVSLWEKFQTNPTITGLDTDFHNWKVPFPAIILCQENPSNLSRIEDYLENHKIVYTATNEAWESQKSQDFLTQLTNLKFTSITNFVKVYGSRFNNSLSDANLKDLVFGLMNRCEDIFDACEWKSKEYNCCDGFFPVFTEQGFCYAFNSRHYEKTVPWKSETLQPFDMQYIKETDIKWALKFSVKDTEVNMPIYILNSDEEAGIDVQPQHVWDYKITGISFSVKQTYTTEDTRQLSIKQRHCVFPDEIKLKTDTIYTYTACTRQCRMDNAMKKCNCIPHFYPEIGSYKHCSLTQLTCISTNLQEIKAVEKCPCQLSCSNTVYEAEKLNEAAAGLNMPSNELETYFVSWPMVRYKREVLFGWVDLLVSFGGIAGLFLGFSLLSGVEIFYYFTIRAVCMILRERNELERIRAERAAKPPEDYDLSLVPYFISDPLPGNGINEVAKGFFRENLYNNKISPLVKSNKLSIQETLLPPFGIEFLN